MNSVFEFSIYFDLHYLSISAELNKYVFYSSRLLSEYDLQTSRGLFPLIKVPWFFLYLFSAFL